jgi:hypothetical protein
MLLDAVKYIFVHSLRQSCAHDFVPTTEFIAVRYRNISCFCRGLNRGRPDPSQPLYRMAYLDSRIDICGVAKS